MTFMRRLLLYRVGNRGLVLASLGLIWMLTAIGLLSEPRPKIGVPEELIPQDLRAVVLYLGPGLFAIAASVWKKLDPTAWGLLMLAPCARLTSFLVEWAFGVWIDGHRYPLAWLGLSSMMTVCFLLNRCAAGLDRLPPQPTLSSGEPVRSH